MAEIKVIEEKCTGCGKCVSSCPFSLIKIEGKKAKILPGCNFCGACVDACPFEAIILEREEKVVDLSDYKGVWVFAEQRDGRIMPVTFELLSAGRHLADDLGEELAVVILGDNLKENLNLLKKYPVEFSLFFHSLFF